jgi:hypothetical protein
LPSRHAKDVDDLQDIGDLEKYVENSDVILIFVSGGYFESRNCLREVIATLEQGKAYLFVHEADPDKGGGPLDVLQRKLDPTLCGKLFDGRRATVWHRIKDVMPTLEPKSVVLVTQLCRPLPLCFQLLPTRLILVSHACETRCGSSRWSLSFRLRRICFDAAAL